MIYLPTAITTGYPMINSVSQVHMPHSLSVQTSGPVSLVHMLHSLAVQTSYSAFPPPHTLLLFAAVLVCLVLA